MTLGARTSQSRTKRTAPEAVVHDPIGAAHGAALSRAVQRRALQLASAQTSDEATHTAATAGIAGVSRSLPHLGAIQRSFGHHDVSGVRAHTDGAAAAANQQMGSLAYATGDHVAFAGQPDLHTAAHEAAHVVQQRGGVQLKGGVGHVGDAYERHADRVADLVVQGRPASALLDQTPGGGGGARAGVQKKGPKPAAGGDDASRKEVELLEKRIAARDAMDAFKDANAKVLNQQMDHENQNWTHYLGKTALNPYLTMMESWYIGLAAGAVTAVIGGVASGTCSAIGLKIGAMIGTAAGPGIGTAIGAALGFVLGAVAGLIIGSLTHSSSTAAADGAAKTGEHVKESLRQASAKRDEGIEAARTAVADGKTQIDASQDGSFIDNTKANFDAEAKTAKECADAIDPNDLSMAEELLKKWVLQHAGDEDDEGKGTDEAQWENAGDETGLRTDGNVRRPDLFLHQTEAELAKTGLVNNFFGGTIAALKSQVGGTEQNGGDPETIGSSFKMTAKEAKKTFQKWYTKEEGGIGSTGTFQTWYLETYRKHTGQSWIGNKEKQDIRDNKVKIECYLDLSTADGACFVNEWEWKLYFPSVDAIGGDYLGLGYTGKESFDTQPD